MRSVKFLLNIWDPGTTKQLLGPPPLPPTSGILYVSLIYVYIFVYTCPYFVSISLDSALLAIVILEFQNHDAERTHLRVRK